ncbi:MAG: EamA family transporter [Chloroflexi bacterium]|nr:MAG: EamA family transporter [Chloroflexota bacterium]
MDKQGGGGRFLVLGAAILWGTTGTAQALAPLAATPLAVGTVRLLIGGIVLCLVAWWRGTFAQRGRWPWGTVAWGAGTIATYQLAFFAGVARTGVAVGTMVAIGSAPVLAGLLDWLVWGIRPSWHWTMATGLAIVGCAFLVGFGESVHVDTVGVLLALGAGGSYAVYALATKRLLACQPADAVTAVLFGGGALLLSPLLLTEDISWVATGQGMAVALHLGVLATAVSYMLFARGLQAVSTATAVTLSLAEPLTATSLGIFLLGEHLTTNSTIGILLLFAGLSWLTLTPTVDSPQT